VLNLSKNSNSNNINNTSNNNNHGNSINNRGNNNNNNNQELVGRGSVDSGSDPGADTDHEPGSPVEDEEFSELDEDDHRNQQAGKVVGEFSSSFYSIHFPSFFFIIKYWQNSHLFK
jgi:hypothetical protein